MAASSSTSPPHRRRRDPALEAELERLDGGDLATGLAVRIERAGLEGTRESRLALETGEREEALDSVLDGSPPTARSFDSKADSASECRPPND